MNRLIFLWFFDAFHFIFLLLMNTERYIDPTIILWNAQIKTIFWCIYLVFQVFYLWNRPNNNPIFLYCCFQRNYEFWKLLWMINSSEKHRKKNRIIQILFLHFKCKTRKRICLKMWICICRTNYHLETLLWLCRMCQTIPLCVRKIIGNVNGYNKYFLFIFAFATFWFIASSGRG